LANPQKENGYTPVANELLEKVYRLKLNGTEFRILMVIWRFTYGFSRKESKLSVNFIAEAIGIDSRTVKRELNKLIDMNVINIISNATFSDARVIAFNKDYDTWALNYHLVANSPPQSKNDTTSGGEKNQNDSKGGGENATQDKQSLKQYNNTSKPRPQKRRYGEYKNVLLTDEEKDKLIAEYGQDIFGKCITKLDEYIEIKRPKYKNHYLVIRKWVVKAVLEDEAKSKKKGEDQNNAYDVSNWYTMSYYDQFKKAKQETN